MSKGRMLRTLAIAMTVSFLGGEFVTPAEAGVGKLWPFASKKHIKKQIDPLTGRISELEEINKQQAARIKDMDERAQAGIRMAMSKTEEADAKAIGADKKAAEAQVAAKLADSNADAAENRLENRLKNIQNYHLAKTVQVNFKLKQFSLDQTSRAALDGLAGELKDSKGYLLEVEGFADPSGSPQLDLELSRQRANSVVRYLSEKHEIPLFRIRTIGMGQAKVIEDEKGRMDRRKSRRVEVNLLRNDTTVVASK
jgi:outer membrane protein OmpA-like peptidoglycan-associated protein